MDVRLRILSDLETSLRAAQRALLERNLVQIEQLTNEQRTLRNALGAHLAENKIEPDLSPVFAGAAARVLQLGRVQAALLSRARQSLRTLSHVMAGTQVDYGPPAGFTQVAERQAAPLCGKG